MQKLLILGGGYAEMPLIKAAKELGFYVLTTGYYKNELGHNYSDEYIYADYSNKEAMVSIVQNANIDYVVPGCNDFSILTASYISEKLKIGKFDSYETTKILHHKDLFKIFAMEHNLNVPKAHIVKSLEDVTTLKLEYPLMVKPIDLSGGKGIKKVYSEAELREAFSEAIQLTREPKIVLEKFIDGTHHSASLLIKNGEIAFEFFADEYFYINKYLVAGASSNFNITSEVRMKVLSDTQKMVDILHLVDGIIHIQFIIHNATPYILEVTRRSPGDLYLDLVAYSRNIEYSKNIVQAHCKLAFDIGNLEENSILRHCIMANKYGRVDDIVFDNSIQDKIMNKYIWVKEDSEIENIMTQKFGIVFFQFKAEQEMKVIEKNINNLVEVRVK